MSSVRAFLSLMLFFLSNHAVAGWSLLQEIEGNKYYVDVASVNRTEFGYEMSTLADYSSARGSAGIMSLIKVAEYDCRVERIRNIRGVAFSGSMGTGKKLDAGLFDQKWISVSQGSLGMLQRSLVCGK